MSIDLSNQGSCGRFFSVGNYDRFIIGWIGISPAAANAVALYMASSNFLKIGDMKNALDLLNNIPPQFRTADIYDLWLRAFLYQGNEKEARNLLKDLSKNKNLGIEQLRSLRTNVRVYTELNEAIETSFKKRDRKAVQSIFHALDNEGHLIPPAKIITFCEQFGESMSSNSFLKSFKRLLCKRLKMN